MPYKQAAEQRQELPSRPIPGRRRPAFVSSRSMPRRRRPEFVPAGRVHAIDTDTREVACGINAAGLYVFDRDWASGIGMDWCPASVEAPVGAGDPLAVYLARLTSPESRRAMAGSLEFLAERLVDRGPATAEERRRRRQEQRLLASHIPWHRLRYAHTQALRSWLAEHCSPAAANRHLAALRGVLREAWRLGLMNGEDLARAIDLASIPGSSLPAGRYVEDGEIRRLVVACLADNTPGGRRDAAVLAVLFVGGLRRAEAVGLDVEDYDASTGHLTVTGKGRRQRRSALPVGGRRALAAWLEVRGTDEGPLFYP